ncbi:MAG: glycoside hydrolase family 43 protein [Muribaculaceae bacterium]|nr:glycoside hydrolase family 43 protein [Muribaculaceae bacterium]
MKMKLRHILAVAAMGSVFSMQGVELENDSVYLMSFFKPSDQHLFYAWSEDGLHWKDINDGGAVFNAYDNSTALRDPFAARVTRNGKSKFHLVHTWGWDHPAIFHWESDDLINWKATDGTTNPESAKIWLMDGKNGRPTAPNAWAPEFFYEPEEDLFYIYWASRQTIDGRQQEVHHYCTTRDWREFSEPEVLFYPGYTAIDLTVLKYGDTYYGFYKDERDGKKCIMARTSKSLNPNVDKFDNEVNLFPTYKTLVEGPETFPLIGGGGYMMYYDKFNDSSGLSYATTADPSTLSWTQIPDSEVTNPTGVRHGSVQIISRDELAKILAEYDYTPLTLLPAADEEPQTWYYTTSKPSLTWTRVDYDPQRFNWKQGAGGFGNGDVPGGVINTEWQTSKIYLRKNVELPALTENQRERFMLHIHHDDDVTVWINGVEAFSETGYLSGYQNSRISSEARATLVEGTNVVCVSCSQSWGGQYIDLGLVTCEDAGSSVKMVSASPGERYLPGYYTLNGIKVSEPKENCIYIHNGKKIIKK